MKPSRDRFGNDRNQVRVPSAARNFYFDEDDLGNLRQALGQIDGFDGEEILAFMDVPGFSEQELKRMGASLEDLRLFNRMSQKELCSLFLLESLTCAALGDEELFTITGRGRDEHFVTIGRLYYAFKRSLKKTQPQS